MKLVSPSTVRIHSYSFWNTIQSDTWNKSKYKIRYFTELVLESVTCSSQLKHSTWQCSSKLFDHKDGKTVIHQRPVLILASMTCMFQETSTIYTMLNCGLLNIDCVLCYNLSQTEKNESAVVRKVVSRKLFVIKLFTLKHCFSTISIYTYHMKEGKISNCNVHNKSYIWPS
jgi:hypothetical protein